MAAISRDIAAMVAAQLTVAWATRAGTVKPGERGSDTEVIHMYRYFLKEAEERDVIPKR